MNAYRMNVYGILVIKQCECQMAITVYGVASLAQSIWLQ